MSISSSGLILIPESSVRKNQYLIATNEDIIGDKSHQFRRKFITRIWIENQMKFEARLQWQ